MKKRILVISWFFPPINSSEGIVTFKLLNNSEYEYDVFTQHNSESWSYGKSDDLTLNNNIHRIDSTASTLEEFEFKAKDYFQKNKQKYDIVMTRSMPEMSHIIGLDIKKIKRDIIWIASFGDPIANNPFTLKALKKENPYACLRYGKKINLLYFISPMRIFRSLRYNYAYRKNYNKFIKSNIILQEQILNNCDYYICNSVNQKDYMLKDYKNKTCLEKKSIILPHSFDDSLYTHNIYKNKKINFTYVGHLDDIRTPHQLFLAIKRLKEFDKDISEKIVFNFFGNMSDLEKLYLVNNDLLAIVKIQKPVKYLKSLEIMERADWLVHIDANISDIIDNNIFFAAKLADYIGAKRNIFGITMINGISANILREYNCVLAENEADEIFNYLYLIIYDGYSRNVNLNIQDKYSVKTVAKEFDNKIDEIVRGRNENE